MWLTTMVVLVIVVLVLAAILTGIATLGRQDGATSPDSTAGPRAGQAVAPVPLMNVRNFRG